ncbi:MAG: MATE family efflux transporter [Ruminococcus sp.]
MEFTSLRFRFTQSYWQPAVWAFEAAISRLCASFTALGKEKESRDALLLGTFLSMALCGLLSFLVYWNADFVASALLKEPRTAVLLRILAFSFPFSALHSCVNSFYYARKTTGIPAFILLLEQTSRIGSTYVIYLILISQKKEITPVIAAGGALFSELTATAACMLALGLDFPGKITNQPPDCFDVFYEYFLV